MKRFVMFVTISATIILANAWSVAASLTTIGTVNYQGSNYNLIYEDNNNGNGLIWMDYTNGFGDWETQMDWATGLNNTGELTFSLNPGVSITNEGNWRLPIAGDNPSLGPNQISSEMGHLHYISLENSSGLGAFTNSGPFENLHSFYPISYYWTSTEYAPISD